MARPVLGADVDTLWAALAARALSSPEELAFAMGRERISYGSLQAGAEALAAGLAGEGVGPGDRVALLLPAGLELIRAFFALQRLGAVPCAFDPGVTPEAAARRIAGIRPGLTLVGKSLDDRAGNEVAAALDAEGLRWKPLGAVPRPSPREAAEKLPPRSAGGDDVALLQPTSGTSGEPRAAMVLQRNVLASLRASAEHLGLGSADVLVSWVPPWHDLGLMRFILGPVFYGAPCHLVTPSIRTLPLWLETVSAVRGTVTGAPDFAYRLATRLVEPRGIDLSSLRSATNGGEPVRQSTIEGFEERFGIPGVLRPGYGLAEATLGVAGLRPGEPLRVDERGDVSCGQAFPGVEVRIAPEPGLEGCGVGEILVRGPAVFAGYFEAEEATRETLRDGWLHTGDVGRLDADGHLYVLGRRRALLKRGGSPLAPRELEEAAARASGVRLAAAVGVPPSPGGATEEIVLVVETDSALEPAQVAADVARAIETALGFSPDRVVVLAPRSIPRTANGKIRHHALRGELLEGVLERRGAVLFRGR